ncbi:hypothetical protein KY289_009793 [Solanum tuberosum]|nr:hypothetical protein KY289_009793 [Solanum tuberosum]
MQTVRVFSLTTDISRRRDVVCILLKVQALTGEGRSVRCEVIVTNERYDRKVMTLWGDFAEIEGQMLQSLESDKPVLAFCDYLHASVLTLHINLSFLLIIKCIN